MRRSSNQGAQIGLDEAPACPVESNTIPSLELRDLRRAMAKVPAEQRQVILLVGLEGMAYEEVARTKCPGWALYARTSRGDATYFAT